MSGGAGKPVAGSQQELPAHDVDGFANAKVLWRQPSFYLILRCLHHPRREVGCTHTHTHTHTQTHTHTHTHRHTQTWLTEEDSLSHTLTGKTVAVFGQPLPTQQNGVGVSTIVWFVDLSDLHRVVHQVVVEDLEWAELGVEPRKGRGDSHMASSPQTCSPCRPRHRKSGGHGDPSAGTAEACQKWREWCRRVWGDDETAHRGQQAWFLEPTTLSPHSP